MTITFELWMLVPALLLAAAAVMAFKAARAKPTGGYFDFAGMMEGLCCLAFVALAAAYLLGRWLA